MPFPDQTTEASTPDADKTGNAEQAENRFAINWRYCLRCLLAQAILCPLGLIILSLCESVDKASNPASLPLFAFTAMLAAPVFETFIFFYLPYAFFRRFIKNQGWLWGLSFVTTTLLFTLDHHSSGSPITPHRNWPMALDVGLSGSACFFACFYLTAHSRRGSPFWTTAACHALYNTGVTAVVAAQMALTGTH
ncbi:CAAX amino terminal protease self- immunity [Acetobacter malorum]|uniref:CAAX amino terminal protease self-immunity n=1 Tax=Acetobacter malorum TaxID=178901 RepID=A0A177G3T7_9PROT|nr:CPBP family glutamic-type intramembrane protease [Acetobacter malorum]OAG75028.1 CAAX amino terminal protease self- immunity [Acetobacter malorum]